MNSYWERAQIQEAAAKGQQEETRLKKELAAQYRRVLKTTEQNLTSLYYEILNDDGTLNVNEFYKFNRYYKLRNELAADLKKLGDCSVALMDKRIEGVYNWTSSQTQDGFNQLRAKGIDFQAVSQLSQLTSNAPYVWSEEVWVRDGVNGAQRFSANMKVLEQTVEKGIIDCVARGASKDELIKTLQKRFKVSFSEAERMARTEISHAQNKAKETVYKENGINRYQFIDTEGDCERCAALGNKVFFLGEKEEGINFPPLHPNCRCTTAPYIEV